MAKNIKRLLAMSLVLVMLISALPMQALAAEVETSTEISPEGIVTDVLTTTSDAVTDAEGNTTVTITIEKTTDGTYTDDKGNDVTLNREETIVTETVEAEDGSTQSITTEEGNQTESWTGDVEVGDKVPDVVATPEYETNEDGTLKTDENGDPIIKTEEDGSIVISGSASETYTETEGEKPQEGDTEYYYSETTTTVNREVEGTIKVEQSTETVIGGEESEVYCPVGPEDYEGKEDAYFDGNWATDNYRDGLIYVGGASAGDDMVESGAVMPRPDQDPNYKPGSDEYVDRFDEGFDLTASGYGDVTDGAAPVFVEDPVYTYAYEYEYETNEDGTLKMDENGMLIVKKDEDGNFVTKKDENGDPVIMKDAEGNPIMVIDWEQSKFVDGKQGAAENTGMVGQTVMFALKHENGNLFYAYCMDHSTGTGPDLNRWYVINDIEDAVEAEGTDGYITTEEAAHIRAIVSNGYWGSDPNVKNEDGSAQRGSIQAMKELMYANYGEDDVVTVYYPGDSTPHSFKIYDLIKDLSEYEALACTQAAIWHYSNYEDLAYPTIDAGSKPSVVGVLSAYKHDAASGKPGLNEYDPAKDYQSDARLKALYELLINLEPQYSNKTELGEDATVIPNEGAITDVALVVKDKADNEAANEDNNKNNDVYNTEVNFKLAFVPGEKDELFVVIYDDNDNEVSRKLLVSSNSEKSGDNVIKPDANGVYTLTGMKLAENDTHEFDLVLEGTQYLTEGVYIYQAKGGRNESQTLVGLGAGTQKVEIHNKITVEFDVDEEKNVVATQVWRSEADPVNTPPTITEEPPVTWNRPPVTQLANEVVEIPEEPVPLAAPAVTGDNTGMWVACFLMIAFGMIAINLFDKKRQYESF